MPDFSGRKRKVVVIMQQCSVMCVMTAAMTNAGPHADQCIMTWVLSPAEEINYQRSSETSSNTDNRESP